MSRQKDTLSAVEILAVMLLREALARVKEIDNEIATHCMSPARKGLMQKKAAEAHEDLKKRRAELDETLSE